MNENHINLFDLSYDYIKPIQYEFGTKTLRKKSPYSELFWSAFFPHFPAFGLDTERYGLSLHIQSKCGKNADQNNPEYRYFSRSESSSFSVKVSL